MQNNINTYHIQQFIEQIKIADMTQQREIRIDIKSARTLALNLGEVLAKLHQDYEQLLKNLTPNNDIVEVRMDGGGFK
jgi:hypothetical protein